MQIAEKRREAKRKGKEESDRHLNAEFQRIARREIRKPSSVINAKKQRKTIEWERLDISSRKLEIQGIFHVKMGTIKDRNGMDLTEAEDIKKRWQGYTEELHKQDLHDPDNSFFTSVNKNAYNTVEAPGVNSVVLTEECVTHHR